CRSVAPQCLWKSPETRTSRPTAESRVWRHQRRKYCPAGANVIIRGVFMKRIYIAAYHQSKFGKLMGMSVPEILGRAVTETCGEIKVEPSALDVGSVGATCNISLNQQGLLAGLVADVPGLAGKPIESVENACASGGQAILSVIQKLQIGWGDTGIAIGYEKMRDAEGKMDGKLVGQALGYFS